MSLIPFIMDLADELHEINRCFGTGDVSDDFCFGIYPHDVHQQQCLQQNHQLRRPRTISQYCCLPSTKQRHHPYNRNKFCCGKSAVAQLNDSEKEINIIGDKELSQSVKSAYSVVNKNGFQVSMNVKQFSSNELTVKTIDNCIIVEGRHEEKEDGHGVISRHFIRKYMLPKGYDPNEVLSTLSSDGILTVKAPPPAPTKINEPLERIIDIQQTGPTQSSVKDSPGKEQSKITTTATPATTSIPTPLQQQAKDMQKQQHQQQQQQQQLQQQKPQEINEQNGDTNNINNSTSNEMDVEQTEPEKNVSPPPIEEAIILNSNKVNDSPADADVDAVNDVDMTAATTGEDIVAITENENTDNIGSNDSSSITTTTTNTTNNTTDNGIADIPTDIPAAAIPTEVAAAAVAVAVAVAADVDMEVAVEKEVVDGIITAGQVAEETAAAVLDGDTKQTTMADELVLLAKKQCENGNAVTEEVAN